MIGFYKNLILVALLVTFSGCSGDKKKLKLGNGSNTQGSGLTLVDQKTSGESLSNMITRLNRLSDSVQDEKQIFSVFSKQIQSEFRDLIQVSRSPLSQNKNANNDKTGQKNQEFITSTQLLTTMEFENIRISEKAISQKQKSYKIELDYKNKTEPTVLEGSFGEDENILFFTKKENNVKLDLYYIPYFGDAKKVGFLLFKKYVNNTIVNINPILRFHMLGDLEGRDDFTGPFMKGEFYFEPMTKQVAFKAHYDKKSFQSIFVDVSSGGQIPKTYELDDLGTVRAEVEFFKSVGSEYFELVYFNSSKQTLSKVIIDSFLGLF